MSTKLNAKKRAKIQADTECKAQSVSITPAIVVDQVEIVGKKEDKTQSKTKTSQKKNNVVVLATTSVPAITLQSSETDSKKSKVIRPSTKHARAKEEPKVPVETTPISIVSVMYTLELTSNYAEIIADCWPKIALYLPYLKHSQCATCEMVYAKIYEQWYEKRVDRDELIMQIDLQELASMQESLLEEESDSDASNHQHALVLNEEFLVLLPKKPKEISAAVLEARKKKAQERAAAKKALKKEKELEENKSNEPGKENEENSVNIPSTPRTTLKLNANHPSHNNETKKPQINKANSIQKEPLDPWSLRTLKSLKDVFYVEHEKRQVSSSGGFEKFTPWSYQQRFSEHVSEQYNWQEAIENEEHYLPFLLYLKQGLGKTPGMYDALQNNPPPEVDIVCDISLIEQRWVAELYRFFPARKGTTVYRIHGYDEFQRRVRKDGPERERGRVVIVDECQEYRCLTSGMIDDLQAFRQCLAMFGLTGTPFMNLITDFFGLNVFMEVSPLETMAEILVKQEIVEAKFPNTTKKNSFSLLSSVEEPVMIAKKRKLPKGVGEEDIENPYFYMTSSSSKGFYRFMYEAYKNRVFFYEPKDPIKTNRQHIYIPMTWRQTFYYVMNSRQNIPFGPIVISSGLRNSFDTMLRRVSNCLMDPEDDSKLLDSPKFDWILNFIKTNYTDPEKRAKTFPMIIFSKFKKRGVVGFNKLLAKLGLKMNTIIMTGDTSSNDRSIHCDAFNRGEIPAFMISRIGRRGLDLFGCKTMFLLEIPDSRGEEEQTISRVLRWGKREAQKAEAIEVISTLSTFPTHPPTVAEQKLLWDCIARQAKTPLVDFKLEVPNAIDLLMELVKKMKFTVDEKCLIRNPEKAKEFERPDLIVKASSIEFENIPAKYEEKLRLLI
jgi:superfamily II DNA or RNA helicase